jgi:hypothetical protein
MIFCLSHIVRACLLFAASCAWAAEKSGPQIGERIEPFMIRGVLDDEAGKSIDLVKEAAGKPLLIYFLHERTRPSVAFARHVLDAAANRSAEGLSAGLVLLAEDARAMEEWVKMVPQVLPRGIPIGVSPDGAQGPAGYRLNRNVQVTVIIAKDNRVVANFALTQPSIEDDAPKILTGINAALSK